MSAHTVWNKKCLPNGQRENSPVVGVERMMDQDFVASETKVYSRCVFEWACVNRCIHEHRMTYAMSSCVLYEISSEAMSSTNRNSDDGSRPQTCYHEQHMMT